MTDSDWHEYSFGKDEDDEEEKQNVRVRPAACWSRTAGARVLFTCVAGVAGTGGFQGGFGVPD
jgi:hypothetical protein